MQAKCSCESTTYVSLQKGSGAQSMQPNDVAECPFCLGRMQLEDREGESWMVCPNGCPTELQIPASNPVSETEAVLPVPQVRAAGTNK